jgi:DNA repair protein RadC
MMWYLEPVKDLNKNSTSIKNWAPDDRPREKFLNNGPASLSNAELLAILIGKGRKDKSAVDLARELLLLAGQNLVQMGKLSITDITQIKGLGEVKALTIAAALELGRRRQASDMLQQPLVKKSRDIAAYLRVLLKDERRELFLILLLNQANRIIHTEIISEGGITSTVADPRIVLKKALEKDATGIILCHNHPSGNLTPSRQDHELTRKVHSAAEFMDIKLLDHVIVSEDGYFSYADKGLL